MMVTVFPKHQTEAAEPKKGTYVDVPLFGDPEPDTTKAAASADAEYPTRCLHPHRRSNGMKVRCGHCSGCRLRRQLDVLSIGKAGLEKSGTFVFVTLTAPSFSRPGVPVHRVGKGCPLCGREHGEGYPLSGVPQNFDRDVNFAAMATFNVQLGGLLNATMTKLRKKYPRLAYFYTIELQSRMAAHVHLLLRFPDEKTYVNTDNLAKLIGGTRLKGSLVQWGPVIDIQQVGDDMNRQIVDLPANKVAPLCDGERLLRYMTKSIRDGLVQDVADIDGLTESERKTVGLYRMWVQRAVDGLPLFDEVNPSECCPVHGAIADMRFVEPFEVFRPSEKERQRKRERLRRAACLRLMMADSSYGGNADGSAKPEPRTVAHQGKAWERGAVVWSERCICERIRPKVTRRHKWNYGLGARLWGGSRNWCELTMTGLKKERRDRFAEAGNDATPDRGAQDNESAPEAETVPRSTAGNGSDDIGAEEGDQCIRLDLNADNGPVEITLRIKVDAGGVEIRCE